MKSYTLYFATNRNHIGSDQWNPESYGTKFSNDGHENLRFGYLTLQADETKVQQQLDADVEGLNKGDGVKLADYFSSCVPEAKIEAYKETLDATAPDKEQSLDRFGSTGFFKDLKSEMMNSTDVVVYIHGFNVSWNDAVGGALALQEMTNKYNDLQQQVMVVLFTWPSEGTAIPYYSYLVDRADARDSGFAVGRAMLKLRDFFVRLQVEVKKKNEELCEQSIHLLCHSMGNYVLQNALARIQEFIKTPALPRLFDNIFLCAADVDDDVFESDKPLGRLHELARGVSIYYNREDKALLIADTTKGHPERLGSNGCARSYHVHTKIFQIDCTPVVPGGLLAVEHSYYLLADINRDIVQTIAEIPQDDTKRRRIVSTELPNTWRMK